jgi:N-acetylneuraminic acid mutarotase
MELYPIFDENTKVSNNIWYSLVAKGEKPFMRVGHTAIHMNKKRSLASPEDERHSSNDKASRGQIYFIGGANPSNCFNEVYVLDLNKFSWDRLDEFENFKEGRYEHSCFINTKNDLVYLFGGTSQTNKFNDIIYFDFLNNKCEKAHINQSSISNIPTPRTLHVGCHYQDQLVVFGGGDVGASAVIDSSIYIFNPIHNKWIKLNIANSIENTPKIRHGHVMVNYNQEAIYMHGGMNENTTYDDFWMLNLKTMSWTELTKTSNFRPSARAAHGGVCINQSFYIFGGMSEHRTALDELWKYDICIYIFFNLYLYLL